MKKKYTDPSESWRIDLERLVRFELLGQEYTFYTGASEGEVREIIDLVQELVAENVAGASGAIPVNKVAILTSLNIASRHIELKSQYAKYKADTEQRMAILTRQIKTQLSLEKGGGRG
jgi:cell division protein ZapA